MTTGCGIPRIIIKHKNNESIYKVIETPIKAKELIQEVVIMLNKSVAVIEDELHNLWEKDTITPPATVYICAFDPKPRRSRKKSSFGKNNGMHHCTSFTPDKYNSNNKEFNI